MNPIRLIAYGRPMVIERADDGWHAFYQSPEGKRWRANELFIPNDLDRVGLVTYIADLLHERATEKHATVEALE
jgi:hypothetical protein